MVLLATALAIGAVAPRAASAAADLAVTVVDTPDPTVPGDTLTIAATVRNNGDTAAVDPVVSFTPPSNVSLDSFPNCFNFIIVSCPIGAASTGSEERLFAAGAVVQLTITLSGLQLGTVEVMVNASHNDINSDPPPNAVTSVTTVEPRADLKLDLAVVSPLTIGNNTTVTATVVNSRTGPARGATLQLVIPVELVVAAVPAGCTATPLAVTCDLGTIGSQATVTREINLGVPTEGVFILLGSVSWSRTDPTPADAQAQVTLTAVAPMGPVGPGPGPGPLTTPKLPRAQAVPISLLTSGVPPARRCTRARTLRFKLRRPSGVAITQADLYVGTRRVKRLTGAALSTTVVLSGLPRKRFTLIVVSTLRDGGRLSGRRTFKACA